MTALDDFRVDAKNWLETNCPASMRTPMPDDEIVWGGRNADYKHPEQQLWLDRMAEKGWTAPTWPKQYGGGGLSEMEASVLDEEMRALGCRQPLRGMGLSRSCYQR